MYKYEQFVLSNMINISNLSSYYPGWWVGGFQSVVILRLSQPSLAGVGAGAELGNIVRKCKELLNKQ